MRLLVRLVLTALVTACVTLAWAAPARADEVTGWNQMLFRAALMTGTSPLNVTRGSAIVHAAMFDAVNGIDRRFTPVRVAPAAPSGASRSAAIAYAAYTTLVALYPAAAQKALFDTKLAVSLAEMSARESPAAIASGAAWGQTVATEILAWRATDGFSTMLPPYLGSSAVGMWRPTPPANLPGVGVQFATMTPWVIQSPSAFRPDGPPPLTSARYTRDFNEVKNIGRGSSALRTPDQTVFSWFWNTSTAPYLWNNVAVSLIERDDHGWEVDDHDDDRRGWRRPTSLQNARILTLLNLAMADAAIGCWDAKYVYTFWRPITAIVEAATDGNPDTAPDAGWTPLFPTPAHPDYPSGHSCVSGAAGAVLSELFGERTHFDVTSDAMPGVVRSFRRFSSALAEVKNARIFSGIHFRFATDDGQTIGAAVAAYVLENALTRAY